MLIITFYYQFIIFLLFNIFCNIKLDFICLLLHTWPIGAKTYETITGNSTGRGQTEIYSR